MSNFFNETMQGLLEAEAIEKEEKSRKINMDCKVCKNCNNYKIECKTCMRSYTDKFSPRELKDNECLCVSCKRIVTNGEIFRYKDNPKKGLCFDCY